MSAPTWKLVQTRTIHHDLVMGLISGSNRKHQHLVWHDPLDNLDKEPFILASRGGLPVACLACPPNPPGVSWIRLFAVASSPETKEAWNRMWEIVRQDLRDRQTETIASLSMEDWYTRLLDEAGFTQSNQVVFYERRDEPGVFNLPTGLEIRELKVKDSSSVQSLDYRAFDGIWRYSFETMTLAIRQGGWSSGLFEGEKLLGYQITTFSPFGAHLARIAVEPAHQGSGYGRLLVLDAIQQSNQRGYKKLSVNTQADNIRSQRLYQRLHFHPAGQVYPVFQYDLTREPLAVQLPSP